MHLLCATHTLAPLGALSAQIPTALSAQIHTPLEPWGLLSPTEGSATRSGHLRSTHTPPYERGNRVVGQSFVEQCTFVFLRVRMTNLLVLRNHSLNAQPPWGRIQGYFAHTEAHPPMPQAAHCR